ncbi:MAG TPA: hypothetical protein VIK61_09285, partial [Acidimicrobiia bacterium]
MQARFRRRRGAIFTSVALIGSFVFAAPATAVDLPSAPVNVAVTAGPKVGQMVLTWSPPATGGLVKYLVSIAADGGAFGSPINTNKSTLKATEVCSGVSGCDFRVSAYNAAGTGPPSAVTTGTWAAPSAPTVSKVSGGPGANQMTVQWNAPKNNGGHAVTGFSYEVEVNGSNTWTGPFAIAGANPTGTIQSARLACSSSSGTGGCTYRMYAQNDIGESVVSAPKSGSYAIPGPPTLGVVTAGPATGTATLNWLPPTNSGGLPVLSYTYDVSTDGGAFVTQAAHLSASPLRATVPCTAATFCSYRLQAVTAKGTSAVSNVRTAAYVSPDRPRTVSAAVASSNAGSGSSAVTVTWLAPLNTGGTPITDYQAQECDGYCSNASPDWSTAPVLSLGAGSTTWSPTCAAGLLSCSYRIRSVNPFGQSEWAFAYLAPFAVTDVTATTIPANGDLSVTWDGPIESGAGIASISLLVCTTSCSDSGNWSDSGVSIPANAQSATHHCGAEVSCTYRVQVTDNASHKSPISASSTATAAALPTAPQNLAAVTSATTTLGAVDLTWQPPLDTGGYQVTGYTLERSTDGGATWPTSTSVGNVLAYTDNACGAGVVCTYHVAAISAVGTSPFSNVAQATGSNVPGTPLNLTAATPTTGVGSVFVQWQAPANDGGHAISGYTLQRSTDGGSTWPTTLNLGTGTSYTDTACGARVACTYHVAAVNSIGSSGYGNTSTANGADVPTAPVLSASTSTSTLGGVSLSWTAADGGGNAVTGYEISVKVDAGAFGAYFSVGNVTSYTDVCDTSNNSAPDSTCTYLVRAINSVGTGSSSNQASAAALVDHVAPTVTIAA